MLEDSLQLDKFVEEIKVLKDKAKLLDILLGHYDDTKLKFNQPKEKWGSRINPNNFPAPTPKEHLANQIRKYLSQEDLYNAGLYNL